MPPQMRASMISSSRSEKRSKCRGWPGNRGLATSKAIRSRAEEVLQCVHDAAGHAAVAGRVVGEVRGRQRRRGRGRRVEQRPPIRVGRGVWIAVGLREADRVDRPPPLARVLVLPAHDRRVGRGQRDHAEQAGVLRGAEPVARGQLAHDAAVEPHRVGLPEDRRHRLVGGAIRAVELAEALDLVQVTRVGAAGQRGRSVGQEPARVRDQERPHVADPPRRVDRRQRRRHAPFAGRGALRERVRHPGRQAPVVRARGEHGRRGVLAGRDPARLGPPGRDRGQRGVVLTLKRGQPLRIARGERAERRRGRGGVLGRRAVGAGNVQVRLVAAVDGIDRVVDRAVHHREVQRRRVRRRAGSQDRALRVQIPVDHRVRLGGRRGGEGAQRADAEDGKLSHRATV